MVTMAKKEQPLGFDILERADELFEGVSDLTLVILKAHLLLEEELYNQLRQLFPNLCAIRPAKSAFLPKYHIGAGSMHSAH
jgi:hypothetical protein